MLESRFGGEEGDLDYRNVQRVGVWVEGYFEDTVDAVIEAAAQTLSLDPCGVQGIYDLLSNGWRADVREGLFVVVGWEAVETVYC